MVGGNSSEVHNMRKFTVILSAAIVALTTAVTMSPAQAAPYQVTASITTSSAQSGDGPVIKGSLTPATPNKVVSLQRYIGGTWTTIETTTTNSDGKYVKRLSRSDLDYDLGSMKFRAKVLATGSTSAGASSSVTKSIYGWLELTELATVSDVSDMYYDGGSRTLTQDGHQSGDDAWVNNNADDGFGYGRTEWDLKSSCLKVAGRAGLDDESGTGAVGKFSIYTVDSGDTVKRYSKNFIGGDSLNKVVDLHLDDRLVMKSSRVDEDDSTIVGFGEPEVLCKRELPYAA